MSYSNAGMENAACDCRENAIRTQTMGELMRATSTLTSEALIKARQINIFLFCADGESAEPKREPACFMEELENTKCDLTNLCEELERLKEMLWLT